MADLRIGVIIPFYNGDDIIRHCLDSLSLNIITSGLQLKIYLINNSTQATNIQAISQRFNHHMQILQTEPRVGFAKANNIGAKLAIDEGAEIIISLNQDTILDKDCIKELLLPFQMDSGISIAVPIQYTYDFSNIEDHFVKYYVSQCPESFYDAMHKSLKDYYPMKSISGACFAMRSETIVRYGFFDPLYFMYVEDEDLCRRLGYAKKKIVMVSRAKIAHKHTSTTKNTIEQEMLHGWQRCSWTIYKLKDLNRSLFFNLLKVTRDIISDYLNSVAKLNFKNFILYLFNDLKIIINMRRIVKSRNIEKKIKREASLD